MTCPIDWSVLFLLYVNPPCCFPELSPLVLIEENGNSPCGILLHPVQKLSAQVSTPSPTPTRYAFHSNAHRAASPEGLCGPWRLSGPDQIKSCVMCSNAIADLGLETSWGPLQLELICELVIEKAALIVIKPSEVFLLKKIIYLQ